MDYSRIESVEQVLQLINESKNDYPTTIEHIIVFTNSKDPEKNKTLKNIQDSKYIKENKIQLHLFLSADTWFEDNEENDDLLISDGDYSITINTSKMSNINTLVFSRLSVQENYDCITTVQHLQDRGFLVLNPVRYSELAGNKYETAQLLSKADIPQPRYCLMTKQDLYDPKLLLLNLDSIYPVLSEKEKKDVDKLSEEKIAKYLDKLLSNEDQSYVCKILDGHGGTGVFLIDGKRLKAVLQTIFAIDPEISLLLQKKQEADGGDIRVHVLTLREKQVILAQMKRVKLGNDFRSNVSLGAEAEPVELSEYQKKLALEVAKLSKLPWCAVDIMPIVEGSDKEFPDNNVILEINSSPGTAGITEVIKENFIDILLKNLDDPNEFMLQNKVAGYKETCTLDFGNGIKKDYLAKLDTGNSVKVATLEVGTFKDNGKNISFEVDGKTVTFEKVGEVKVKAGYEKYDRPYINIPELTLGQRKLKNVLIGIVEHRDNKSTNLLLNTDILSKLGYVIHPTDTHILTHEIEKVKIL